MITYLVKYFIHVAVYIIGLVLMLCFSSCEKEIDIEYHEIAPLPVIEASLTQDGAEVRITLTTPMDEPLNNSAVTDAFVTITDLTSGVSTELLPDGSGVYRDATPGEEGHTYRLQVRIGDNCYISEGQMLPFVEITHIQFHWIRMPGDDMAALQVLFTDNPLTSDYYWVRVYRNGEAYMWSIITDRAAVGGSVEEVLTTTHRDESQEDEKQLLREGDVVDLTVTPISRSMFDYLNALMNNSNGAPQFEGGRCVGFFLPSPVASATIIYSPDDINYAQ